MLPADSAVLFASLIFGSIGAGYLIYGKKQTRMVPMLGGIALVAASYFLETALSMSLVSLTILAAIHWLWNRWD